MIKVGWKSHDEFISVFMFNESCSFHISCLLLKLKESRSVVESCKVLQSLRQRTDFPFARLLLFMLALLLLKFRLRELVPSTVLDQ